MTILAGVITLGVVVMVWCSYLDARDRYRERQLRRRWDEIESQIKEDLH